jgi:hypothetical protein
VELQVSLPSEEEKRAEVSETDVKTMGSEQKSLQCPRTPTTLRDALARGKQSVSQLEQQQSSSVFSEGRNPKEDGTHESTSRDSPIFADRSASPDSSPFLEQEDSLHSTSERNYLEGFYDMGRSKFTSKQSFQEANYLSSLSSNTFSNQSIMSMDEKRKGGILGSTKSGEVFTSPMSFNRNQTQFAFRVEPVEGTSLLGTELPSTMSPGPSMRSGHSMAHSIISVSPRGNTPKGNSEFDYLRPSPSKRSRVELDPTETLPENDDEDKSKVSKISEQSSGKELADGNASTETNQAKSDIGFKAGTIMESQAKDDASPLDDQNEPSNASSETQNRPSLLEPPEDLRDAIQKSLSYKQNISQALLPSSMRSHSDSPPGKQLFMFSKYYQDEELNDFSHPQDLFSRTVTKRN